MRVLFIYPDVGTMLPPEFQHGVGLLIALLKNAGHEPGLFYLHEDPGPGELIERARAFEPGLVCFSSATNQYPRALAYARELKSGLSVPVIIGGIHATLASEEVIAEPAFDLVCVGEGEGALVELAEALDAGRDYSRIENLWVKRGGAVSRNPVRPLVADLDSLPFADREAFHFERILEAQKGRASLLSGRGCPFGCAYCANQGLRELYRGKGKFTRHRSVDRLLAEMRELAGRYPIEKWDFNDDIFTLDRGWVLDFCERYGREFSLPFDVNVRVETVDRGMLEALKAAGCEWIRVGVESGSDRVRREIMNRRMERERIVRIFAEARELGLLRWSFNMVGLPGETPAAAEETYELNRELCPDHMQVSVFNPYPGTALYRECVERGALTGTSRDGYFVPDSSLSLPEFPPERIHQMHQRLVRLRDYCHSKNKLERELAGIRFIDLVDLLGEAELETPEAIFAGEDFFTIDGDTRRVLRVHPPSRVRFRLKLPPRAGLRFSLALHPQVWERGGGDGVIFTVRAGRLKRRMKELFRETIDPKRQVGDRAWHDRRVSLASLAGKRAWIEFSTAAVDPSRPEHNTAGFGYPIIVEGD